MHLKRKYMSIEHSFQCILKKDLYFKENNKRGVVIFTYEMSTHNKFILDIEGKHQVMDMLSLLNLHM